MSKLERIWERVRAGHHTAVIGELPQELPPSCGFYAVRIECGGPARALGPLLEAQKRAEDLVGGPQPMFDQAAERHAAERVRFGLRRRLLDEMPEVLPGSAIVESLNRLKRLSGGEGPWALIIDHVDAADEDTLLLLREMIIRRGWLQLPLVICFWGSSPSSSGAEDPESAQAAVLAAIGATEGADGIQVIEADLVEEGVARSPLPQLLRGLPADVVQVLRAGALIGSGFEAELVAALLSQDAMHVLDRLQVAADAGLPLTDNGDGRFDLPDDLSQGLRASMLPSLAIAWHRRLAELLSQAVPLDAPPSNISSVPAAAPPEGASASSTPAAPPSEADNPSRRSMRLSHREAGLGEPARPRGDVSAAAPAPREPAAPSQAPTASAGATGAPGVPSAPGAPVPEAAPAAPVAPLGLETSGPAITLGRAPLHWPYAELFPTRPEPEPAAAETSPMSGATPPSASSVGDAPSGAISIGGARKRLRSEPTRGPAEPSSQSASGDSSRVRIPADLLRRASTAVPERESTSAESPFRKLEGTVNDARAAGHLVAAGEIENGAARFLSAAREAAAVGAHVQAVHYAREALGLIESLPAAPRRRRLRIVALCELGRLQWQASGPGGKFTLPSALESLSLARSLLEADDPLELRSSVSSLLASVLYDVGDLRSLERALRELTDASRAMLDGGDAVGAARLLNDQAAVYVRLGDPVRASHLLEESRRVFERLAPADASAALEMAETDHLLARLPLHVAARPGREADAISMGKNHAQAAEQTYRKLGAARELTRVWETLGRLELRAGRIERALSKLTEALQVQRELGDVIGLARTTAALAEVLSASTQHEAALGLLRESIALNLEKGSPIGLAYNRRTLEQLGQRLRADQPLHGAADRGAIDAALEEAMIQLTDAEQSLGRILLPGDPG
ncbi:MAG: tetratricopeptide repeat protein [Polyangia bacterium]